MDNTIELKNNFTMCVLGSICKSEIIMDIVPSWIKNNPNGEITAFDPKDIIIRECKNKIKYVISEYENFKWVDDLLKKYKNSENHNIPKLLILYGGDILFPKEDIDKFRISGFLPENNSPRCPQKVIELLAHKRIFNMDIIITFRTPDAIPVTLEHYISDFAFLPILEDYKLDKRSHCYDSMRNCIDTMNIYHKENGIYSTKEYLHLRVDKNEISSRRCELIK